MTLFPMLMISWYALQTVLNCPALALPISVIVLNALVMVSPQCHNINHCYAKHMLSHYGSLSFLFNNPGMYVPTRFLTCSDTSAQARKQVLQAEQFAGVTGRHLYCSAQFPHKRNDQEFLPPSPLLPLGALISNLSLPYHLCDT